jgi:hypothetical protein
VRGLALKSGLNQLVNHFENRSIPSRGRYVKKPAITDENGIVMMPLPTSYYLPRKIGVVAVAGLVLFLLWPFKFPFNK